MRLRHTLAALSLATIPTTVSAQEPTEPAWEVGISGGITAFSGDQEQPFGSLSIKHDFSDFYASLGGTIAGYSGPPPLPGNTIPATTKLVTIGAGYETNALALDMYASFGDRDFDDIPFTLANGAPVTIETGGNSWAVGISVTYQLPLGGNWYASPVAALDYSEINTALVATAPGGGFVTRDVQESGVTGSGGITLQYAFGAESQHSFGVYSGIVATSNAASTTQIAGTPTGASSPERIQGPSQGDVWFEYGASASFGLSDAIVLDLSVSRTAGLEFGEATSGSAGLTFLF